MDNKNYKVGFKLRQKQLTFFVCFIVEVCFGYFQVVNIKLIKLLHTT